MTNYKANNNNNFLYLSILLLSFSCLSSVVKTQDTNNTTTVVQSPNLPAQTYLTVRARIDPIMGGLIYELIDINNNMVSRQEKFFPVPPIPVCSQITTDQLYRELRNNQIMLPNGQNVTIINTVYCCDYYLPSLGYQYTQCGQNLGIFILIERKGTSLDQSYLNQQLLHNNVSWEGLVALLNQYCVNSGFQGNFTSFLAIPVPWQEWYTIYLINPRIENWSKQDLKDWINRYEQYINAGGPVIYINDNMVTFQQSAPPASTDSNTRLRRRLQVGPWNAPSVNNIINPPDSRPVPSSEQQQNDSQSQQPQQTQQANQTYWLVDYDNPLILTSTVIANLTARGIYPLFYNWYRVYFYPNGVVTQYYEAQNLQNGQATPNTQSTYFIGQVPPHLLPIVNWISSLVSTQVKENCGACVTAFTG
ncbi:UNKNOWN [Stylonychia lemnae]|uniref:Uncharacterized protein n=1 Tax=Stylonychia lemnae TaxID=5949 RepID=A0A078ASE6_STYLE|nr:UNKNOWN [Stylonychia lemnae]|eukprot:CDW83818.1 UNKNOWN [Stylonychia lemnae]